jgi:hypothetical protein
MSKSRKHNNWKIPSDEPNIRDSVHSTGISKWINQIHSSTTICLVAGTTQVGVGLAVIAVSILGFIQPLWLSTLLTMIASLSTMIGCFLVYHTISKMHDPDKLLRDAMRRVTESKN